MHNKKLPFQEINIVALKNIELILSRWLPNGRKSGQEYIAKNPTRADHKTGSFKINMITGRWADFATGDRGGDPISLAAYLFGLSQGEAARNLAKMLGMESNNHE